VVRDSPVQGPPTLIGLPPNVSVGVLRIAIARAVFPMLLKERLVTLIDGDDGDMSAVGDELLVLRLAQKLPLVGRRNRIHAREWLPTFADRRCQGERI